MMMPNLRERQLLQKEVAKAEAEQKWKELQEKNKQDAQMLLLQIKLQLSRTA